MTTMPAEVVHGKVVGRFLLAVADATDPDRLPDARPATGQIVFTPTVPNMKTAAPDLATVIKTPIRCSINADGYLTDPEDGDGVWLVAGIYRVTYALTGVMIASHVIEVLTDHTDEAPLDLTNALPPSGPGISPSQYTTIMARLDAINYPVESVNGMLGAVVLVADDVDAYSKSEADARFLTEAEIPGAPVLSVNGDTGHVVVNIPDAPVTSVNGQVGSVSLDAGDVGALTQSQADARYSMEDPTVGWVTVVDPATDARPDIPHVLWSGGATKPANMVAGDLWIKG